jgi:hypothetical protein
MRLIFEQDKARRQSYIFQWSVMYIKPSPISHRRAIGVVELDLEDLEIPQGIMEMTLKQRPQITEG